jgi:hypothetical protein
MDSIPAVSVVTNQVRVVSDFRSKISVLKYLSPYFVIVHTEAPNLSATKVCDRIRVVVPLLAFASSC